MELQGLFWGLFLVLLLAAAMFAGLWGYRAFTTGDTSFSLAWLFPPKPEPRLGVMEEAKVDRVRRLVLVRRDDVEHLIMTGGPVDVVIETGIAARRTFGRARHAPGPTPPVFSRKHGFGQAVNE
jgi:hypothetical protein